MVRGMAINALDLCQYSRFLGGRREVYKPRNYSTIISVAKLAIQFKLKANTTIYM